MKLTAQTKNSSKGFTLIELLVVIGILAVLLAITLIAINPAKQFAQANDTKRQSDVNAILNAVNQYMADNKGNLPTTTNPITSTPTNISNAGIDLCAALSTKYIAQIPSDPKTGTPAGAVPYPCPATYDTGYQISKSAADNRITVSGTAETAGVTISVTR